MRTTEADFFAEILAAPDDDAPRLVFADWLEDQGDERAEFIRVQCELAQTEMHLDRWWELHDREQALLAEHAALWLGNSRRPRLRWGIDPSQFARQRMPLGLGTFRRGFPELATALRQMKLSGARLLDQTLVRDVFFQQFDLRLTSRFMRSGWMQRLQGLYLPTSYLGLDFLATVAESPAAANLRRLELPGNFVQREGLEAICSSPHLTKLEALNLGQNRLQTRDLEFLLHWPGMESLRALWLYYGQFGDESPTLPSSDALANLHLLDLGMCRLHPATVTALLANEHLSRLTHLSLDGSSIPQDAWQAYIQTGRVADLRVLNVERCDLVDEDIELLVAGGQPLRLRQLVLGNNQAKWAKITRRGVRALATSPSLRDLRWLSLSNIEIDVETAEMLVASENLPRLQVVRLTDIHGNELAAHVLQRRFSTGLAWGWQ